MHPEKINYVFKKFNGYLISAEYNCRTAAPK
jgi:hypothetical protein